MCWSFYEYCSGFWLKQKLRGLHCISGLSILYPVLICSQEKPSRCQKPGRSLSIAECTSWSFRVVRKCGERPHALSNWAGRGPQWGTMEPVKRLPQGEVARWNRSYRHQNQLEADFKTDWHHLILFIHSISNNGHHRDRSRLIEFQLIAQILRSNTSIIVKHP